MRGSEAYAVLGMRSPPVGLRVFDPGDEAQADLTLAQDERCEKEAFLLTERRRTRSGHGTRREISVDGDLDQILFLLIGRRGPHRECGSDPRWRPLSRSSS